MANLKLKTQFNDLVDASVVENQIEDLTSSLDDYALKQQEAFIEPTLLNSWVNFGGAYSGAGYMKDEFGFVHLRGAIKSGTSPTIFNLPVGYRPALRKIFVSFSESGAGQVLSYVEITDAGVCVAVGGTIMFSLENIIFKAGA
jgi:hypothetical protein